MRLFRSRAEWPYVVSLTSGWFCAAGAHDAQQIDSQVLRTEKKAVTVILRFSVAHPKAIVGDYCHFLLHSTEEELPMLSRARWRESTAARRWGGYVQGFTAVAVLLLIGVVPRNPRSLRQSCNNLNRPSRRVVEATEPTKSCGFIASMPPLLRRDPSVRVSRSNSPSPRERTFRPMRRGERVCAGDNACRANRVGRDVFV